MAQVNPALALLSLISSWSDLTGLGLYICKNLTRLLGGSIGVASEPDEGSQFSFYVRTQRGTKPDKEAELPGWLAQATKRVASTPTRTEVSTTAPPEAAAGRLQSAVSGFKILVVEDNLINQKVMKRQLEARQCTVFTANNGKEAVEFVKSSSLNPSIGHEGPDIEICFMVGFHCTCVEWILTMRSGL